MANYAKNIMFQGTSSHVGKSVLSAALIRALRDRGFRVAPFKAQNMALNSAVAVEGGEIGRAQAFQAEAAGLKPSVHMNPVLLKPTGDSMSQVIIHGKPVGMMTAAEYHAFKKEALGHVRESYSKLALDYDVIVIEGAGSPAEVNLRENDIANMGMAGAVGSPVVLIGDIDRGGVFASLVGTLELLSMEEREMVKGFIINKFRGDIGLLKPGLDFLEARTGKGVLGVVPSFSGLLIPDEDSVSLDERGASKEGGGLKIAVVKLPRLSNFTDFDPFRGDPGIELSFISSPREMAGAGLVIIPGTKSTIADLMWMKSRGFGPAIREHIEKGGMIAGICGGLQMLGTAVKDPQGVESSAGEAEGFGLVDAVTVLHREKKTFEVSAVARLMGRDYEVRGYEIHMGETIVKGGPFSRILERNGKTCYAPDGAASQDGMVWGTYVHGIFDNDVFRQAVVSALSGGRCGSGTVASFESVRERAIDSLASIFEDSVDMERVLRIIGV
ncbi:MAG: cobyric acid synthase [Deltaproteobacteria bacterium]|nr:cobyric acid synthase [Deltaproteobacteria bacterium]MCL4874382.1 cobyric acid synthase [bacterium]